MISVTDAIEKIKASTNLLPPVKLSLGAGAGLVLAQDVFANCSVPNFDADTHVRFFRKVAKVKERYGRHIAIERMEQVRKPWLTDLSMASRLRALRWNRYRPANLARILGAGTFDSAGGWFVFSGRKLATPA